MTYEMKERCVYCGGYEWMSCFTDARCRNCHEKRINDEMAEAVKNPERRKLLLKMVDDVLKKGNQPQ